MIPLHDKNRICPKCVCHINTTRHARHFPVRHEHRHKLVLMEARWNDPGCVPSHGAHPCGSASVPRPISSAVGNPQGGRPPYQETDANDWFVLIKIITKCWYSLIVQNIVLLFFYRNLTFAQVYMRIQFLKSQSTNMWH